MKKHSFTKAERYAVWKTHGSECFWCGHPLELQHASVDHVLPEELLDDEAELKRKIALFGLPASFRINGFENWVAAHPSCNSKKSDTIYQKSQVMLAILERLQKKAADAQHAHDVVVRSRQKSDILGKLAVMVEHSVITRDELLALFGETQEAVEEIENLPGEVITRFSERWTLVSKQGPVGTATDGRLVGYTWIGKNEPDSSWRCPTCSSMGPWSGARCLNCGHFSDD